MSCKAPTYRFKMLRLRARDGPYYVRHWSYARPITVFASTEQEARDKVLALSGDPGQGCVWLVSTTQVDEGSNDD